jgi:hypothetical protein
MTVALRKRVACSQSKKALRDAKTLVAALILMEFRIVGACHADVLHAAR